jgi:D-sedoheptulose 7-phosphate isomerase
MNREELRKGFEQELDRSAATIRSMTALAEALVNACDAVSGCLLGGGKILTCGNGGSAADASHLATELVVRFQDERRPYPAISLCDSGPTLTAAGNDYGFDHVFARQVRAHGKPGDVLIAISTSGKSKNVILALEAAKQIGMKTIALLGKGGGPTRGMADVELIVPSDVTARVQEGHLVLYHAICTLIDPVLRSGA